MENYYVLSSGGDLYHWGIKGMRWGVRRYQNKDGSLTAAGQKRRDKLQAKLDKIDGTEKMKNSGKTTKKIGDMTDEELSEYITRKNAEKVAYGLERDIANLNPKKVSAGEQFVANLKNELSKNIADAGGKAVKELMNKAVEKALGQGAADPLMKLKKEAEKAGYMQTIANAKQAAANAKKAEREANKKDEPVDAELAAKERAAKMAEYDAKESNARKARADADFREQQLNDLRNKSSSEPKEPSGETSRETKSSGSDSSGSYSYMGYDLFNRGVTDTKSRPETSSGKSYTDRILALPYGGGDSNGSSSGPRNNPSSGGSGKPTIIDLDPTSYKIKNDSRVSSGKSYVSNILSLPPANNSNNTARSQGSTRDSSTRSSASNKKSSSSDDLDSYTRDLLNSNASRMSMFNQVNQYKNEHPNTKMSDAEIEKMLKKK